MLTKSRIISINRKNGYTEKCIRFFVYQSGTLTGDGSHRELAIVNERSFITTRLFTKKPFNPNGFLRLTF